LRYGDCGGKFYIVDTGNRSTNTTIKYSKDADILFHEGLSRNIVKQMEVESGNTGNDQLEKIMFDIQDYHTSPVEAAEVANEANVKELVLYHLVPAPPNKVAEWVFMRGVDNVRSSGVTVGYDGLTYILPIDSKDIYQEDLNDRQ
jgi:ribonuclease Z